jgi:hypothetical protein
MTRPFLPAAAGALLALVALVAAERSDAEIAGALGVPLEQWLECRLACGQPPVPLHEIKGL